MPYDYAMNSTGYMYSSGTDIGAVFGLVVLITLGIIGILLATNIAFFKKLWNSLGYTKQIVKYLFIGGITFFSGKGIYYGAKYLFTVTAEVITLKQVLIGLTWFVAFVILGFIVSMLVSKINQNYKTIKREKEIIKDGSKDVSEEIGE